MRHFYWKLLIICFWSSALFALPPLKVAVSHFSPPFVVQGANNKLTGFDIVLMTHICQVIKRECVFVPMDFASIIPATAARTTDVGIDDITITLERYRLVNFSVPYMTSEARFLARKPLGQKALFNLLSNKPNIGVEAGTIFENEIKNMANIKNPNVTVYKDSNDMIAALSNGSLDLVLQDNPTSIYWQNHSANALFAVGKPFIFGNGLGIAINKNETLLLQEINTAIQAYQKTAEFKQIYNMYFGQF